MRLYIGPMDAVLVAVDQDGRVRFDGEDWSARSCGPSYYSAQNQVSEFKELIDILEREGQQRG